MRFLNPLVLGSPVLEPDLDLRLGELDRGLIINMIVLVIVTKITMMMIMNIMIIIMINDHLTLNDYHRHNDCDLKPLG